jgi:endonuclease/exonuclease/phosphatase family metal-dependent hydrolase
VRAALALAVLLVAPSAAWSQAGPRETVDLSVLTYNTRGLPAWIARDDPPARFPQLLEKTEDYDVVLVQEDFAFHDLVRRHRRHPLLLRGNGPREGWLGFQGSGLTLLSRLPWLREHARPYDVCHGWLGAANDCLGSKGFLMARLALGNGAAVDVWDTHLDAGPAAGDDQARGAQLERLAAEIEARSRGRALLVGGDFNLHWQQPRDRSRLESFAKRLALAVAARAPAGAGWRQLDNLLVRSGVGAAIEVLESGIDPRFVDPAGAPLSDHPAVFAKLRIR